LSLWYYNLARCQSITFIPHFHLARAGWKIPLQGAWV